MFLSFPFQIEDVCKECHRVSLGRIDKPPRLRDRFKMPMVLEGEWISKRCETRPNTLFLTRRLSFMTNDHSWSGLYQYYSDQHCSKLLFSIVAKGKYLKRN